MQWEQAEARIMWYFNDSLRVSSYDAMIRCKRRSTFIGLYQNMYISVHKYGVLDGRYNYEKCKSYPYIVYS